MEWIKVLYNGFETNVEVTKCGKVRKVKVDFTQRTRHIGEIDFNLIKKTRGYSEFSINVKNLGLKKVYVHQLVAAAFLDYKFQGHKMVVDHINSNKENNSLDNLRVITTRENNSKERRIKTGLPTGVCWNKNAKKYMSQIFYNKKAYYLGIYKTIEEASNAYESKLKTLI